MRSANEVLLQATLQVLVTRWRRVIFQRRKSFALYKQSCSPGDFHFWGHLRVNPSPHCLCPNIESVLIAGQALAEGKNIFGVSVSREASSNALEHFAADASSQVRVCFNP